MKISNPKHQTRSSLQLASQAISSITAQLSNSGSNKSLIDMDKKVDDDVESKIVKEGHVEIQKGQGNFRRFNPRYAVIHTHGFVELFEKQEKQKLKETFTLQGGEQIEVRPPHAQRFRFKILIPEQGNKLKDSKWVFGFSSESLRDEWHETFKKLFARLVASLFGIYPVFRNAVSRLHQVVASSTADSLEGKLTIAECHSECDQLNQARRIYSQLLKQYGNTHPKVHIKYEEFLSKYCNDVHQAEQNFVKRLTFFCLPKHFLTTLRGKEFTRISRRVEFLMPMKVKLIDAQRRRQRGNMGMDDYKMNGDPYSGYSNNARNGINGGNGINDEFGGNHGMTSHQMDYRNLENMWPTRLFAVDAKHHKAARKMVKQYFKEGGQSDSYHFEYSYRDIEQRAWYLIKRCVYGQKGVTRIETRLKLVTDSEMQKELESEKHAIQFERGIGSLTLTKSNSDNEVATNSPVSTNSMSQEPPLNKVKSEELFDRFRSIGSMVAFNDDEIRDILDDLDEATLIGAISMAPQMTISIIREQLELSESEEDNEKYLQQARAKSTMQRALARQEEESFWGQQPLSSTAQLSVDVNDILNADSIDPMDSIDPVDAVLDLDLSSPTETLQSPSSVSSPSSSLSAPSPSSPPSPSLGAMNIPMEIDANIMVSIRRVLESPHHHIIYPWTAFLLIWKTRRDEMGHIGDSNAHKSQIEVILEFIYLFARGCFLEFESNAHYALLLQTLFRMATSNDFQGVKYKMTFAAVSVLGDHGVGFCNKLEVARFLEAHQWLNEVPEQNQDTMRRFYLRGFRGEMRRIVDELNAYYRSKSVYGHKHFLTLQDISGPELKRQIVSQDADKVQGSSDKWGRRLVGSDGKRTGYDPTKFKKVCALRDLDPVPKPTENPNDFDECYLLYCLAMAEKLNDHFQRQIEVTFTKTQLRFKHYPTPIKDKQRCYELMKGPLRSEPSPKAAKILDYCSCNVTFESVSELVKGFKTLEDNFTICRVMNWWDKHPKPPVNNYKYMIVYIVCNHPKNDFIKLVCGVRMTLDRVYELNEERKQCNEMFGQILKPIDIKRIMNEVMTGQSMEEIKTPKAVKKTKKHKKKSSKKMKGGD